MSDEPKPNSAPKEGAPPATKPAEVKPAETKPTATAPRPVGRLAAQVALYLGLLSVVAGIVVRYVFPGHLAMGPRTFGAAAALCFLVSIAILLAEIERKIGER